MRLFLTALTSCAVLMAQTPAATKTGTAAPAAATPAKSTPAKTAPAATGTATAAKAKAKAATPAKAAAPAKPAGPNLMNPATLNAKAPEVFQARFNTTKGAFVVEVTRAWAPNGADHFYNMVRAGYYNDAGFFRVVPGFMVQFGISAKPEVSRIWADRKIPDDPVKQSNTRGMMTYAQTGAPNSRSTQLFINFGDNKFLDSPSTCRCPQGFMPFAKVIEGMDVVDSIYSGYGEQPDQGRITEEGKAYLDKSYPRLDRVLTATIVPAAPAAAPGGAAPAAAPPATKAPAPAPAKAPAATKAP